MNPLVEKVRRAGVVGAGGAGFPAYVKLAARVEWLLANGAECEPLLHKDRELMTHFAPRIVEGMHLAAEATGATRVCAGIKTRNRGALDAMRRAMAGTPFEISEFGDFYPSGDEYEVVYSITGRLIPPGGIPPAVGAVVSNVETLYNVAEAVQGRPVTRTFLTITGCVRRPLTAWIPLGMSVREVLELAGGASVEPYAVMDSGLMMGRLVTDLSHPVSKTTAPSSVPDICWATRSSPIV
jgi:Na+-translocating ferredoxin:NAD+ oxidoreductase RnfC subunit